MPEENIIWKEISDEEYLKLYGDAAFSKAFTVADIKTTQSQQRRCAWIFCCCRKSKKKQLRGMLPDEKYYYSPAEVDAIDQTLYNRLETERKARKNWRKLLTMI